MAHGARVIRLRLGQSAAQSETWIRTEAGEREDQGPSPAATKAQQQLRCHAGVWPAGRAGGRGSVARVRAPLLPAWRGSRKPGPAAAALAHHEGPAAKFTLASAPPGPPASAADPLLLELIRQAASNASLLVTAIAAAALVAVAALLLRARQLRAALGAAKARGGRGGGSSGRLGFLSFPLEVQLGRQCEEGEEEGGEEASEWGERVRLLAGGGGGLGERELPQQHGAFVALRPLM